MCLWFRSGDRIFIRSFGRMSSDLLFLVGLCGRFSRYGRLLLVVDSNIVDFDLHVVRERVDVVWYLDLCMRWDTRRSTCWGWRWRRWRVGLVLFIDYLWRRICRKGWGLLGCSSIHRPYLANLFLVRLYSSYRRSDFYLARSHIFLAYFCFKTYY